jgi:hypothetical protein
MITIAEHVMHAYQARACFLCGEFGECPHREFEVEAAFITAEFNRRVRMNRRPMRKKDPQPEVVAIHRNGTFPNSSAARSRP